MPDENEGLAKPGREAQPSRIRKARPAAGRREILSPGSELEVEFVPVEPSPSEPEPIADEPIPEYEGISEDLLARRHERDEEHREGLNLGSDEAQVLYNESVAVGGSLRIKTESGWVNAPNEISVWICPGEEEPSPVMGLNNCVIVSDPRWAMQWIEGLDLSVSHREVLVGEKQFEAWHVPGLSMLDVIAAAADGKPVTPNLLYFFRPNYVFHPGTAPLTAQSALPVRVIPVTDEGLSVMTLDTGKIEEQTVDADLSRCSIFDEYEDDEVAKGHGPAIADLIGRVLGDALRSKLSAIDAGKGCLGAPLKVRHNKERHANLSTAQLQALTEKPWVRCFDTLALHSALTSLELTGSQILNLSFGTMGCPSFMGENEPIYWWLLGNTTVAKNGQSIVVTVAAGNHGTAVPSYPAAYGATTTNAPELANVVSVGSSTGSYSGTMFDTSFDGNAVVRYFPNGKLAQWAGTSFAAPTLAARLAQDGLDLSPYK